VFAMMAQRSAPAAFALALLTWCVISLAAWWDLGTGASLAALAQDQAFQCAIVQTCGRCRNGAEMTSC